MLLDNAIKDLLLALNINRKIYTYSLICDYKYSHKSKSVYPKYKLTAWQKNVVDGKKTSKRINYWEFNKKSDLIKCMSDLVADRL